MFFRHSGGLGITIDRRRGGINEPFDPLSFSSNHHRLEAPVIDFFAESLIQFEAGIIGNTGEMDDCVDAAARVLESSGIPNIAFDDLQAGLRRQFAPVRHDVEYRDIVPGCQQLRGQQRTDIAGTARNQRHSFSSLTPGRVFVHGPVISSRFVKRTGVVYPAAEASR